MMPKLIILTTLVALATSVKSQTFLEAYKTYSLKMADTLSNTEAKQKIIRVINTEVKELRQVFESYKTDNIFDFNTADTLFLIYEDPADAIFSGDVIVWSGKDTISYTLKVKKIKPTKFKRIISYKSFFPEYETPNGYRVVTGRDSLVTLVSKRDYTTLHHLGDNQQILDGSYIRIYVAYKIGRAYNVESCFPKKFFIPTKYIKQ